MKTFVALLLTGAMLFPAIEANAKSRTRDQEHLLRSRHVSQTRSDQREVRHFEAPNRIFNSFSGGNQGYSNPDRDFSGPNAGGKEYYRRPRPAR